MRLRSENKDRGAFDSMNQDLTETKSEKQNIFSDTGRKRAPVNALQQAPVTGTVNEMGDFQNSSDLNVDDSNLTEQSETQINHLHTNNYQRAREVLKYVTPLSLSLYQFMPLSDWGMERDQISDRPP